jgi:hypothetical protein
MRRATLPFLMRASAVAVMTAATSLSADPLTITTDVNPAPAGVAISFRFAPKVSLTGDSVAFVFGDGGTGTVQFSSGCLLFGGCDDITHAYAGAGVFTVSAVGTAGGKTVAGSLQVTVTAGTGDQDLFVGTGAHLVGFNDVNWRTDLEVNNPGTTRVRYMISLLLRDQDNSNPAFTSQFTLEPGRSAHYPDLLMTVFGIAKGAAAVRVTPIDGPILVNSRTYNQLPSGTFGQFVPAVPRAQAIGWGQDARLIGLSHDPSLASGFRTNLGLVNLSPAPIRVEADFRLGDGTYLGRVGYDLLPFEFIQTDRAFEQVTSSRVDDGYIVVRTTTAGARFLAYASVTDNVTGDPTYVPTIVPQ